MLSERRIGACTVRVECAQKFARAAQNVLDEFEKLSRSGRELVAGTKMRFGWTLFHLNEHAEALHIDEPDFAKWPQEAWCSTIDTSLEVLTAQVDLLRRLDVDAEDAYFDQFVIAAPGAISQPAVFLRRDASISPEDSGWVLGSVDDPEALMGDTKLERIAIASLATRRRALLQVLSFPRDFLVTFTGDTIGQLFDAAGRDLLSPEQHNA